MLIFLARSENWKWSAAMYFSHSEGDTVIHARCCLSAGSSIWHKQQLPLNSSFYQTSSSTSDSWAMGALFLVSYEEGCNTFTRRHYIHQTRKEWEGSFPVILTVSLFCPCFPLLHVNTPLLTFCLDDFG